eukprot:CAMPEP_0202800200 /NCGR_PEP_ID=MMETSP1388-20130828/100010_1 /ASSEMBLY_ACC=CAM_ASM_000864 /TAXON_ID=37098 /ORGANISM="Isochrysis sp, Strain CCMP1244" /LENGTH=123 /DNA_ID=CAMNT_0049470177 /DNA_START=16 /DNA_END=383 /DNA_ORIENTATION=+
MMRINAQSTELSNTATRAIATFGRATATRDMMTTAASKQGSRHCSSQHANDAPTAECQAFCADQFRKFHCLWCKCRACTFCPREDDKLALIEELHPPPPPPSPAQPVGLLFPSAVQRAGTGLG